MNMLCLSRIPLLLTIPVVLPAVHQVAISLRFTPKQGVSIRRTLELKSVRERQSLTTKVDGEVQKTDDSPARLDLATRSIVVDGYVEVAGSRLKKIERTFESVVKNRKDTSNTKGDEVKATESSDTSALEGRTVMFTWNEESKSYAPQFKSGKSDEALLAGLHVEMDYQCLLPEREVTEGTKWEVDIDTAKSALLRPGGELPFTRAKDKGLDKRMRDAAWDAMKGTLHLECKPARELNGAKIVSIGFEGSIEYDVSVDRDGAEDGPDRMSTRSSEKLHGELLWDASRGGPRAIQWNSKGRIETHSTVKQGGQISAGVEVERITLFDQDLTFTGAFEVK